MTIEQQLEKAEDALLRFPDNPNKRAFRMQCAVAALREWRTM